MASTYVYRVRDKGGRLLEGSLEADSTGLVAARLREMGYFPITIEPRGSTGLQAELHIPGFRQRVKGRDLAVFARQFATMINAGLTMLRALAILSEQTVNPNLAKAVDGLRNDVETGASLSQALARHPKVFNQLFVSMVRAGEASGVLDTVLAQLATTLERQAHLRSKIRSAMAYPVAVLCLVSAIATAMLIFVVPMFKSMYKQVGGTLPAPTQVLLHVSSIFKSDFPILVVVAVIAVVVSRRALRTEGGRTTWDGLKLRIPIFGRLVHKTAMSRFARTLSVLLRSGVPILESLEITAGAVGNSVLATAVRDVQSAVKTGEPMARPLANHRIFPAMVTQMMAVGEETGALDEMLEKISGFYDQEIESLVDALTSLIEPLLIVFMGVVVGGMVICLYLPMFNIINAIKQ
jgi:type IV pilus assembly protein PilC